MSFASEFPNFPAADMPPLPDGFKDSSWHNDSCPSYYSEALGLHVFIDYVDHAKRDIPELGVRFSLIDFDAVDICATDDWREILDAIDSRRTMGA